MSVKTKKVGKAVVGAGPVMDSKSIVDGRAIRAQAEKYKDEMVAFLRELIRIPSESGQEEKVVWKIKERMLKLGFDEAGPDKFGNIRGRVGKGKRVIAIDGHIDTVGVGDPSSWQWDPFEGKVENGIIYGRGACDQTAGVVSAIYAGRIIKDLKLENDYSLYVVGSVMEEDCDGLSWLWILKEENPGIECVISTEPTACRIYRGHRGRMEIEVETKGLSCHGSAPERGVNAVYKMAAVVKGIEKLNERLLHHPFLGKGTITISHIRSTSPSLCAVADSCTIHLDRRLTVGETKESAVQEVKDLCKEVGIADAQVRVLWYKVPTWTGNVYPMEKYYPTWLLKESHPVISSAIETYSQTFGKKPVVDKWTFSTNGVAITGLCNIPCFGFGPSEEWSAHSPQDQCPIEDMVTAAAFYAAWPSVFTRLTTRENIKLTSPVPEDEAREALDRARQAREVATAAAQRTQAPQAQGTRPAFTRGNGGAPRRHAPARPAFRRGRRPGKPFARPGRKPFAPHGQKPFSARGHKPFGRPSRPFARPNDRRSGASRPSGRRSGAGRARRPFSRGR